MTPTTAHPWPPCDLPAERRVLGACLLDQGCLDAALSRLTTAAFHASEHRLVWDSLSVLRRPDPVMVLRRLRPRLRSRCLGWLIGDAWHHNLEADLARLARLGRQRRTLDALHRLVAEGYDPDLDTDTWLAAIPGRLA